MSDEKNKFDFSEKYAPKKISDLIGCESQINQLINWLKNYNKNKKTALLNKTTKSTKKKKKDTLGIDKIIDTESDVLDISDIVENTDEISDDIMEDSIDKCIDDVKPVKTKKNANDNHSCMLITGNHGCGKTCVANTVLNELGYSLESVILSKIGSNKNIIENINKITRESNIMDIMNSKNNIKRALIIDDIHSANSPVERNYILTLLKINEEKWYYPVIFICNKNHSRIITTIKDNANIIYFNIPTHDNLFKLFVKIGVNEKMCFDSEKTGNNIINHAQNDYRRLLFFMQNLQMNYRGVYIDEKIINECYDILKKKDLDIDIFKAASHMMTSYDGIDECLKLYKSDPVIIPLVIHQNFLMYLSKYDYKPNIFDIVYNLAESLSFGDLIEDHIFSDQNWDMTNVHGFFSCVKTSYIFNKENIKENETALAFKLKFPFDLNRTSIKQINKKNIVNSNICLKNLGIDDFIFANKLIKNLLEDCKFEKCAEIFNGYDAKIENIESLLKIDKINTTKTSMPSNVKKKISKHLKK